MKMRHLFLHSLSSLGNALSSPRGRGSLFLLSLCFTFSSLCATSYTWGSATGNDAWDGGSGGGLIEQASAFLGFEDLKTSYDGTEITTQYGLFKPAVTDDLLLVNTVKIKGDVEIRFDGDGDGTTKETFIIDVGDVASPEVPTKIQAFTDATTDGNSYAQLVFNPAQNKTIVVNVISDFFFQSGDPVGGGAALPLYVTFRGQGTTVFRLPSGRTLSFAPQVEGKVGDAGLSLEGVQVRILMDQSSFDVFGDVESDIKPRSQVVFEKWSEAADYWEDGINVDTWKDTWVKIGQLSSLAFVSANYHGIGEKWVDIDNDDGIDAGEPIARPAYGSVAFDPSNDASGRLILDIARGQNVAGNDFTDGAVNVYGVYLLPTLPGSDRTQPVILNSDLREFVFFNQRAGIRAVMRVTDDVAYAERIDTTSPTTKATTLAAFAARTDADRRGLVVMCHNNTLPKLANNIQMSTRIDLNPWALSNNYQPGFILGINGELECFSHTFIDYYANNVGRAFDIATHMPGSTVHTTDVMKIRNPAALFADGLFNKYEQPTKFANDDYGASVGNLMYIGSRDDNGIHARVSLYGNAGLYVRSVAPFDTTALPEPEFIQVKTPGLYYLPEHPSDDTLVMTAVLGIGQYDGKNVKVLDDYGAEVMQSTTPEGEHALCVEGPLSITTWDGAQGQAAAGFFKVPSIKIDYAGREVYYTNYGEWLDDPEAVLNEAPVAQRPLPLDKYYAVYNVSSILVNDHVYLDSINLIHDDVTRNLASPSVLPNPGAVSRPHIVGGELPVLRGDLRPSRIHLNNATISCHESLVATGVGFTVNEITTSPLLGEGVANSHNVPKIVFYNRGREYDINGRGRVLQLGSQGNRAADGVSTPRLFADAFIDIYRAAPTVGATAENKTVIRLSLDTANEPTVTASEKAMHMVYLANDSQIVLGWPTEEADSGYTPSEFDSTILKSLQRSDSLNKLGYRFNTYDTGVGHLRINGGPLYIGAGDETEALPPERPISGIDVGGVVYVNHGGKLSITGTNDVFIDTVVARRVTDTAAASGDIKLPRDQSHFLPGGVLQQYDIDFAEDKRVGGDHDGHVLLPIDNNVHLIDVNRVFKEEDEA